MTGAHHLGRIHLDRRGLVPFGARQRQQPFDQPSETIGLVDGAMGGQVHMLALDAPVGALARARAAVHTLERQWSRFRADSEVTRINAADGRPVAVSTTTAALVSLAVRGWVATGGAYDPTVLDALVGAGYDRSFEQMASSDLGRQGAPELPVELTTRDGRRVPR